MLEWMDGTADRVTCSAGWWLLTTSNEERNHEGHSSIFQIWLIRSGTGFYSLSLSHSLRALGNEKKSFTGRTSAVVEQADLRSSLKKFI